METSDTNGPAPLSREGAGEGESSGTDLTPTKSADRIASLDFIRGIAVLGILAANIISFGQPPAASMWPDAFLTEHGEASNWLWVAQMVLVDGKMRGLFTLLFGAGLVLFLDNAEARGSGLWPQMRRLGWLLLFGVVHYFFIWRGDILNLYAVLGMVALLFLRKSASSLIGAGLTLYLAGALLLGSNYGSLFLIADTSYGDSAEMAETRLELDEAIEVSGLHSAVETQIMTNGNYGEFVAHNLETHLTDPLIVISVYLFETLPIMFFGMALFKIGMFNGGIDRGKQKLWGWAGVIIGTALTVAIALWVRETGFSYWGTQAAFVGITELPRLPVVLGLAALLALWSPKATGWLGSRLSAAGRMAFSNYLGTSLLMMLVFHPWAGGLWGELNRPQLYLVMVLAWIVMLGWSKPWLERYRYGPLEWLWRCLTYWKIFPFRKIER